MLDKMEPANYILELLGPEEDEGTIRYTMEK